MSEYTIHSVVDMLELARLTSIEVQQITGYRQPGKQLAELLAVSLDTKRGRAD